MAEEVPTIQPEEGLRPSDKIAQRFIDPAGAPQSFLDTFRPEITAPATPPVAPSVAQPPDAVRQAEELARKEREEAEKRARGYQKEAVDLARQPTPQPPIPRFRNVPPPPDPDRMRTKSALQDWKSAGMLGVLFFSGLAKGNMRNAMAGATGMIDGYQAGDKEKVERERKIWKDQTEAAIKQNDIEQKEFDAIMKNSHLSMQDKMAKINTLLAASKDEVRTAYLRSGDIGALEKIQEDRAKWAEKLGRAVQRGGAPPQPSMPPETIDSYADMYNKYGPTSLPKGSMRDPTYQAELRSIYQRADEKMREQGLDPGKRPEAWQRFAAGKVAIQRFVSGPQGNTIRSLGVVVDHIGTLEKLIGALDNGDYRLFNGIAQRWAEQTGSDAPTNFDTARSIIGTEIIKGLGVAGAGTEKERSETADRFSRAGSPAQLRGAIKTARSLLAGQLDGLRRQFNVATKGTAIGEKDFNEMLGEEARSYLERRREGSGETPPAGAPARTFSDQDKAALDWATANPNDPRAKAIKDRLGVQ